MVIVSISYINFNEISLPFNCRLDFCLRQISLKSIQHILLLESNAKIFKENYSYQVFGHIESVELVQMVKKYRLKYMNNDQLIYRYKLKNSLLELHLVVHQLLTWVRNFFDRLMNEFFWLLNQYFDKESQIGLKDSLQL